MITRKLGAACIVLAASALIARPAAAQANSYDFDLAGTAGEPGLFHVKLQKWDGAPSGPGTTFRIAQTISKRFPNNPIGHGAEIDISFFGQLGAVGPTVSLAGISGDAGITTITSSIPANPQTHDWPLAVYNGAGAKYASFTSPTGAVPNVVRRTAINQFMENASGRITTSSLAASARVTVKTDNGHLYSGVVDVSTAAVPEASSLMLLLPGLVPLGVMVRRRIRRQA